MFRRFHALVAHQLQSLLIAPSTYVVAFIFSVFMGGIFLLSIADVSRAPSGKTPIELFLSLFWVPVLFVVPLLTMRSIAEERRMGTLSALMTTPVSSLEIIFSKFLACYIFYVILWSLTLVFPIITLWVLPHISTDERIFSISQILMGYMFIFISGATYVAIGIFASSFTRTTLVAGMLSFCLLFIAITGSGLINKLPIPDYSYGHIIESFSEYIQSFRHLEDFSNSLFDTRPFFLYISSAIGLLAVTSLITESKSS